MPLINHAGGGSSFAAIIQVTYTAGATCTCSNGSKTLTAPDTSGSATFIVKSKGTWTITIILGSRSKTASVIITTDGQVETAEVFVAKIYGISRDITKSSPAWTRTDDAVGFTAIASVGTVAGSSSFDNCMPWSGIQREVFNNTTKDVMVKIPRFWYRRYREGNVEYIKIADREVDGFAIHPAFNHAGIEKDSIYVGAYLGDGVASLPASGTQASSPSSSYPSTTRADAKAKGAGWGLLDLSTLSAIQMLIMVEFATNNVQSAIGAGYASSYDDKHRCGGSDSVPNLTGSLGDYSQVVWRGIEDVWGNARAWIDGCIYVGGEYYVNNNPANYGKSYSNFTQLSYSITADYSSAHYITQVGLDTRYPHIMLPTQYTDGSNTTYYCDVVTPSKNSGELLYAHGGAYDDDAGRAGLFFAWFQNTDAGAQYGNARAGSRLLYIPQ